MLAEKAARDARGFATAGQAVSSACNSDRGAWRWHRFRWFRRRACWVRRSGKTYVVARAACGVDAVYVFACDHPDASRAEINIMFEITPAGERIRRPGFRTATRH
jgi:hypothetical protein